MNIEVTGINLAPNPKWDRPLTIAAFCDVRLGGLSTTLFGVALARSKGKWVAMPPKAVGARPNDPGVIKWDISGPVPQAISQAMLRRYEAFGGPTPPPLSEAQQHGANAARRIAEKGGDAYIEDLLRRSSAIAEDDYDPVPDFDPVVVTEDDLADDLIVADHEATQGVLRTLRAEAEICDRAGL